ncbi:lysozyme inhibitor LprI family protein [Psychrobacter sp. I-STPA10]|nr:lysozyme inhibitor LprI family protein [Psychrobacter sp. I-STPA10]
MKLPNRLFVMTTVCLTAMGAQAAFEEHNYDCEKANLKDSYQCSIEAVKTEKQRLNGVYMNIYRNLTATQKQQMDNKQIAWNKKRDENCGVEEDRQIVNNDSVWQEISANTCVAYATQDMTRYYLTDFNVASLAGAADFKKIKTDGTVTYYKGETVVKGTFNISAPDDDYSPCAVCFSVSNADS